MGKKRKGTAWTIVKPLERFRNFLDEQHVKEVIKANGFTWGELKEVDPKFRHQAPYPSYIPLLPILMTTKVGSTVLDIYNGTGTTSAVARQLGRKAIGYDTDTESHKFAAKRLRMVEDNLPTEDEIRGLDDEYMEAA
jgi:DNA modification methylase